MTVGAERWAKLKRLIPWFSDVFIATGSAIVVFSLGLILLILASGVPVHNPYIGLFAFVLLPVLLVLGAVLFVIAVLLGRTEEGRISLSATWKRLKNILSVGFVEPRQRRRLVFFLAAGGLELVLMSVGGYSLAKYMDTPDFCGQLCHQVMGPQYQVYQASVHARVPCVSCHIGTGESWLVRAKLNGVRQLFSTVVGSYPRPLPAHPDAMRPARETCGNCHWREKFSGEVARPLFTYGTDAENTPRIRTLFLKVGGGPPGVARGIHWHATARVWYLPRDAARQDIAWSEVEGQDGRLREYLDPALATPPSPQELQGDRRLMDCIDCHNRDAHDFRRPGELLDRALFEGSLDPSLPFIKKRGLEALETPNSTLEAALKRVDALEGFYRTAYPEVSAQKGASLARALAALRGIAAQTTFPHMGVTPTTYPDNLGHNRGQGCMRCHGRLVSATTGAQIDGDCRLCHELSP